MPCNLKACRAAPAVLLVKVVLRIVSADWFSLYMAPPVVLAALLLNCEFMMVMLAADE